MSVRNICKKESEYVCVFERERERKSVCVRERERENARNGSVEEERT